MSFLENQLRQAIGQGFKGNMLVGTLTRSGGTTVDQHGDIVPLPPQEFRAEGMVEGYDARYRTQAGIPETDSKILLILANCETEPQKDDRITFPGWPEFQVRNVMIDPARATAECQSFNP